MAGAGGQAAWARVTVKPSASSCRTWLRVFLSDRKITPARARQRTRQVMTGRSGVCRGPVINGWGWRSGCLGEGDGEAERFELPDVVAGLFVFVGAAGVVAGAEFMEGGGRVGEQVPDDHQDGAGDRDQGLELAAAPDDPPVAFAEEGVGLRRGGGGLTEDAFEIGVALA